MSQANPRCFSPFPSLGLLSTTRARDAVAIAFAVGVATNLPTPSRHTHELRRILILRLRHRTGTGEQRQRRPRLLPPLRPSCAIADPRRPRPPPAFTEPSTSFPVSCCLIPLHSHSRFIALGPSLSSFCFSRSSPPLPKPQTSVVVVSLVLPRGR